jgi:protein-S-isoprenylcysteine O-methyltransferase Ste14
VLERQKSSISAEIREPSARIWSLPEDTVLSPPRRGPPACCIPRRPSATIADFMKLLDHFGQSGDRFFRLRSYLPLLLLPAFVAAIHSPGLQGRSLVLCQFAGFVVSLAGLAIRVITIGAAPPGTSERSTTDPRASLLNTLGPYSVVRHPLYVGNTVVAIGLAISTATWYTPVLVLLASLLYHERICVREEVFLEGRFGDQFREWAERVPAMLPAFSGYVPSAGRFRWKKVIGREFHALFVIGAGFFVLDGGREAFAHGRFAVHPLWWSVFAATGALFVLLTVTKKLTSLLAVSESSERRSAGA